jgi:hypothetical protein
MIIYLNWLYGVKEMHGREIYLSDACSFDKINKIMSELWLRGDSPYF